MIKIGSIQVRITTAKNPQYKLFIGQKSKILVTVTLVICFDVINMRYNSGVIFFFF